MGEVIGKNSTAVEHGAQAWASPITPTYTRAHTWTACRHDTHTCCKDVHTHTHTSLRTQAVTNAEYFILFYFIFWHLALCLITTIVQRLRKSPL